MTDKNKIIKLRSTGLSYGSIGKMVGLSRARVHQICSGYHPVRSPRLNRYIFLRDNYGCQWGDICKFKKTEKSKLVIHHIDFNDRNNVSTNLITLCRRCHSSFHAKNHIDKRFEKNIAINNKRVPWACNVCKKMFWNKGYRKTCSDECFKRLIDDRRVPPEEAYKRKREMIKRWQKKMFKNPEYKKKIYEKNKVYAKKYYIRNKDLEGFKKRAREFQQRRYYGDVESSRKKARERYHRMKAEISYPLDGSA